MEIKRGDIYWAKLSEEKIGSEQGGVRPVVIIQNDVGNKYSPTVIVAKITSRTNKKQLPTHVFITAEESGLRQDSIILVEQIQTIDKIRLSSYIGKIDNKKKLDEAIQISTGVLENLDIEKKILEKASFIKGLDITIEKWIGIGGSIELIEDEMIEKMENLKELEAICKRLGKNIVDYYEEHQKDDEMRKNNYKKVV